MTPEQRITELERKVRDLEYKLSLFTRADRYLFTKTLQTIAGGKIGFYGETPIAQQSAISAPSGGITQDAEARTAINSIRTALTNIGITS